jgi:protein involved in polysaccharide export with SLBB domain
MRLVSQGLGTMKLIWKASSLGLFACGLLFTGCHSSPIDTIFSDTPTPPVMTGSPLTGYSAAEVARFHVGDTVIVSLSGLPQDIPIHQEPIKEDGTITMPDIGHVQAVGKTAGELQNEIYDLYVPKLYRHLTVTVNTGDRVYYVTGEVKMPGRQLYAGQMTVTKAITTAGDFTDFANHRKVWLIRANGQRIKVNCNEALRDPSKDPLVYPNDQVQVPRRIF